MDSRDLQGLMEAYVKVCAPVDEAVYGGEPKKPEDTRMVVTAADKKANTPAYQKFKAGHKGYKAADHLGEESVDEAVKGESSERRRGLAAERKAGIKPLSAKEGEKYADYKMAQMAHSKRKRMGEEVEEVDEATAMAKRGYDEAPIRQKIAKSTGGGKAADRATKLADQPTFGQRGVDPKARQNLARAQRGDFRQTTSSSPGLHGYGYKSDDPAVKAKQAARGAQRGVLTPAEKKQLNREEFDTFNYLLEYLVAEGYADTNKAAIAIMANMSEEWRQSIMEGPLDEALTGERYKKVMKKPGGTAYSRMVSADPRKRATRGGRGGESDFGAGDRGSGNRAARRAGTYREYDVNEAQEARNNPEKYEREQSKKYAPARGERTPMPPRGDKRREDFEKWYAANVR